MRTHLPIGAAWPGIDGALHAGIARGTDGDADYHLVLLEDKPPCALTWGASITWARCIGADLPTRDESALLYACLREHLERGWHWTSTQSSNLNAWFQYFDVGTQSTGSKKSEARARAVRRFPLQSFAIS